MHNFSMPCKNILKTYTENGIYHIYNRGVEKRDIFLDEQDYKTFLYFLKQYLLDPNDPQKKTREYKGRTLVRRSFIDRVELLAYCLMPNHFHLLIKQKGENDMTEFIKCLATSYSMYFNDKYKRVGSLFQGRYKAVLVENDDYLLHLSRYIHINPDYKGRTLAEYSWSSYQEYLGIRGTKWVKPEFILNIFSDGTDNEMTGKGVYKEFVEELGYDSKEIIGGLTLE